MPKKTVMIVVVTVLVTLVLAPKLRSLPIINKLPTV